MEDMNPQNAMHRALRSASTLSSALLLATLATSGCWSRSTPDNNNNNATSICGNGRCEAGETQANCPADCTPVRCGNGVCEAGENSSNCPADCPVQTVCGNLVCEPGENSSNCPTDCAPVCGNGTCEVGEDSSTCPADCPVQTVCGNLVCEPGENSSNCPADCPAPQGTCSTVADLTLQDGCEAGEKCTVVSETALGCAADGTVADYAECGGGGVDDCQAGAICAGTGTGPNSCLPFCDATHPCTGGVCAAAIQTPAGQAMLCLQFDDCDLFDASGCGTGEGCYIMDQQGNTICGTAGTVAVGASCQYVNDCGIGAQCFGDPPICTKLCHDDNDCPAGTGTCLGIGSVPGDATLGACGNE